MKPTKKIESEVLKVYDTWLYSYLNGDVETYSKYLDDDYHFIGSTNNEEFLSRNDTSKFFADTYEQLAGKCDLRKETRTIEQFGELVFITHLFDAWFPNETDLAYYGRFLFTNALRKNQDGWRFIHQHFSTPDANTEDGKKIGFDKINKENLQLREAIKRGTVELEAKNRELEIESALEKVRSRMLKMHKSSDLEETTTVMYRQLNALGVVPEGSMVYIVIIDTNTETSSMWMVSDGKLIRPLEGELRTQMTEDPRLIKTFEAWKRKDSLLIRDLSGNELEDFKKYIKSLPTFLEFNSEIDHWPDRLVWSEASFSYGTIGLIYTTLLPPETLAILVRFSKVFDLTYTRFLDLQKAEAQTREAEIEVALERIRAKAMAMRSSNDLMEVANTLREQMRLLDQPGLESSMVLLYDEEKFTEEDWFAFLPPKGSDKKILTGSITWRLDENEVVKKLFELYKSGVSESTFNVKGEELEEIFEDIKEKFPVYIEYFDGELPENVIHYVTRFSGGHLLLTSQEEPNENSKDLQRRVTSTFDLAYNRFLDLQKAEAQAREAQIEAALERVRSRTMAMQYSNELSDTATMLFQQIQTLGIPPWSCGFNIWEKGDTVFTSYMGSPDGAILKAFKIPLTEETTFIHFQESRDRGDELFIDVLEADALETHYRYFQTLPGIKEIFEKRTQAGFPLPTFQINHLANFSHGNLMFITYEHCPEAHDIFIRFAKVFEQTYTRFLDLQKAEAQAREAQIEAALERVRSRTMAMQHSDELAETASLLFQQVSKLGMELWGCSFNIWEPSDTSFTSWWGGRDLEIKNSWYIPLTEHPLFILFDESRKRGDKLWVEEAGDEKLATRYQYMLGLPDVGAHLKGLLKAGITFPKFQIDHIVNFSHGNVLFITYEPCPEAYDIFKRFAQVFEQTYTRFLDLQKAEAQTREAQIEAALERVRSRSMAMHKSEELLDAGSLLYHELLKFGISSLTSGYCLMDSDAKMGWNYISNQTDGAVLPKPMGIPHQETEVMRSITQSWKKQDPFHIIQLNEAETVTHQTFIAERTINFNMTAEELIAATPKRLALQTFNFKQGYILIVGAEPLPSEKIDMLVRFAKVFEMTYQRFLDLQKAEAQAREAQIEAALERVRSRSMAMQRSDELPEVALVLWEQLKLLKLEGLDGCAIHVYDDEAGTFDAWSAFPDLMEGERKMKLDMLTVPQGCIWAYEEWDRHYRAGEIDFCAVCNKQQLNEFIDWFAPHLPLLANEFRSFDLDTLYVNGIAFSNGILGAPSIEPLSVETWSAFKRLAAVFDLAYRRFADLQKAEAQAREAQIEAALEKVRSRSLAMYSPDELQEVVTVVGEKLQELGVILDTGGVVICTYYPDSKDVMHWTASFDATHPSVPYYLPYFDTPIFLETWASKNSGTDFFEKVFSFKDKNDFFIHAFEHSDYKNLPEEYKKEILAVKSHALSFAWSKNSALMVPSHNGKLLPEEHKSILKRFAKVFEQAYIRFMDLQKAEEQAREAQIEAALERVRSRSMAMQHSSELNLILAKVFEELTSLELEMERAVILTYNAEDRSVRWWAANPEAESGSESFFIGNCDDPVYNEYWKAWEERRTKYLYILEGEYKENWTDILFNKTELGRLPDIVKAAMVKPERIYLYNTFNDFGVLFIACLEPMSEDKFTILERFGKVFDQSYTRFNDIKQAEARAQEAIKQSSLDRVRGQIASMRSTADLDRITPLVWDELTTLGVPFIRCGVFIINEATQIVKAYLSSPKGESLGVLDLPFATSTLTSDSVAYWRKKKVLQLHWDKKEFVAWTASLMEQGLLKNKVSYQGSSEPPDSLDLHFIPFDQGMLYVGSEAALSAFQIELAQALSNAFSVAYARYEDFAELEHAKLSIENTLTELKATQKQLVQSEKMASLGELTAGIAHEIQNPLNFVNNFSEVSNELIDEMNEEIEKGDLEEAKAIACDLKQNLEKINHHGKRADAIVKGMLQHSRSSSGTKEPTDINGLADEYLRLAYHGLRAKDKSFNATMKTEFDENLEKVNVIPQDMGRVILNLITNAFYAVNERKKLKQEGYEPTVTVKTQKEDDKVFILVQDNGKGIPDLVKEKIFQPFFTTKPTGQGTGLGLSMSYDIVKAHGGELKVGTKENEGSEFTITLPI